MSDWFDALVCAHVDCDADRDIIETLRDLGEHGRLNGWIIAPLNIPGAHPWCLTKGDIRVALYQARRNVMMTSNVLPIDEEENAAKSNRYIEELHTIFNNTGGILNSNIG
ncbi:hypothetical protein [Klebsiella sp. WP3-W18-ESBL-02]|uniref:hypothetical protein n=1 Tax=Klebsiella sp. WP3-W18-ESBL-02 TaxID=2675710 RepID=UPI0015FED653|nr:hypothetical protein [Klebsiella sp. WP3-W18-ESBL-02]